MIFDKVGLWLGDLANDYISVVTKPPKTNHTEKHHILPVSLFPEYKNDPENIVLLDVLDHLQAHEILAKTKDPKMVLAFWFMFSCSERRYSKLSDDEKTKLKTKYELARIEMKTVKSEWAKTRVGKLNSMFGKPQTEYAKTIASKTHKNKILDLSHRQAISKAQKGIPKKTKKCKYCHKDIAVNLINRWHNDNCKFKP